MPAKWEPEEYQKKRDLKQLSKQWVIWKCALELWLALKLAATDALCLAVLFSRGLFSECQRSNRVRHSSLLSSDERAES